MMGAVMVTGDIGIGNTSTLATLHMSRIKKEAFTALGITRTTLRSGHKIAASRPGNDQQ